MKHIFKVIASGVALGLAAVIIQSLFHIPQAAFMRYFWIFGVAAIAAAIIFNGIYIYSFQKKARAAAELLNQGKPEEFIQAVEALRKKAKGRHLQNLLTLYLSVGYSDLKQHKRAIELLCDLNNERLSGAFKLVQRINLCACYFYDGQSDNAMAIYADSQKLFHESPHAKFYGGNVAVLDIFALIENGEYAAAKQRLAEAREQFTDTRLQEDYESFEQLLKAKEAAAE